MHLVFYNKKENFKVIDIVISHSLNFEQAYQSKVIQKAKSIEIYLISINDLIIMKQALGRGQDLSDIKLLRKVVKWMEEEKN